MVFDRGLPQPAVLAAVLAFSFLFVGYAGRGVAGIWERPPVPPAVLDADADA